jgi:DNA-binding cell septation regulator SpoVG
MHNMTATEWRECIKNTLRGFFTLTLPSGIVIHGCQLHEKNARRWIGLPARPYTKDDGTTAYARIIEFISADLHQKFQAAALGAVDALLETTGGQG